MADTLTPSHRSWNMSRIRGTNTEPEIKVRSLLHAMGFRFRLHRRDLPGKPDIVLSRHRTAIFVHGCFWHRHEGCRLAYTPKTRSEFWLEKFRGTQERDRRALAALLDGGWKVLVIWECEIVNLDRLQKRIRTMLGDGDNDMEYLGEKIRRLRSEAGLAQDKLALRAGIDQSGLSKFERGKKYQISDVSLRRVAEVLGVPYDALVSDTRREP